MMLASAVSAGQASSPSAAVPMRTASDLKATDLARLTALVARLRAPDGCPWDREQRLPDLRAYLLEEAHEVAAAIDAGDPAALVSELGDLIFQVAFVARLEEERGAFTVADAIAAVEAKMIARHPHVFGGEALADANAVREAWERRKVREADAGRKSLLDGATAASLPALVAAYRLTQKAAGVGFDWKSADDVLAKLDEELEELRQEIARRQEEPGESSAERVREEVGDLLFTVANLARHLEIDPEGALARANLKFRRRFAAVEGALREAGRSVADATLDEMEAAWSAAKRREREPQPSPSETG